MGADDVSLREYAETILDAAERLALQRCATLEHQIQAVAREATEHVEQLRRERELVTSAQMDAIRKAEVATEKRFDSVNEFRNELSDRWAQTMPREVAEKEIARLSERLGVLEANLYTQTGETAGGRRAQDRLQPWMLWAAGGVLTVFLTAVVVVTNVLVS